MTLWLAGWLFASIAISPGDLSGDVGNLRYAQVQATAKEHDTVILWQGVPRLIQEKGKPAPPPDTHPQFDLIGQKFYRQSVTLSDEEAREISAAVLDHREHFNGWSGVKFCGGFHADDAVEWRRDGKTLAYALFCFGCGEAKFVVPPPTQRGLLRTETVDMSAVGRARFLALFRNHHVVLPRRPRYDLQQALTPPPEKPMGPMAAPSVEISPPRP